MARMKEQSEFRFPMKGIHRVAMKNEQPEGTCFDALNVRPYDTIEERARGGSRPGLKKYSSARTSVNRVQDLNRVTSIRTTISPSSLSRRDITLVQVTNGVIAWMNTTSATPATVTGTQALGDATETPFCFSAELFGKLYFADGFGYKVYSNTNTTAYDWVPTAGVLPGDQGNNVVCRLIETWRGRIVMAGLPTDPHNWFMSKLGDPLDFDYAPATETELDAVTGGQGFVGRVPDVINSIIPYTDDVLIFGCDHSIWMMSGDPQAGGRLDLVTNTVGMAFGRPYTQLPDGTLMFFSNHGSIYRMPPGGGKPTNITEESIDPLITDTNLNTNLVRMAYDEPNEGVHVFITPLTPGNTTHWYYDLRNQGWFKVEFGSQNYNPASLLIYDGDEPSDRVILFGGEDGYVRQYENGIQNDDGDFFETSAIMGPIEHEKGKRPCILTHLQFIMDDTSTNTIYEIGAGDTAEEALADFNATFTGETDTAGNTINVPSGKSRDINPRERGFFIYFKVGSINTNTQWAIEYIHSKYSVVKSSLGRQFLFEPGLSFRDPDAFAPPTLNTNFLWNAYWASPDTTTISNTLIANSVQSWTPSQTGSGKTSRNFTPTATDDNTVLIRNYAPMGNRDVIQFNFDGTSMFINTINDWDMGSANQWFCTMAIWIGDPANINDERVMTMFNESFLSQQCRLDFDNAQTFSFYRNTTGGLGDTHTTANTFAANTAYILTWGAGANGNYSKSIRINGKTELDANVNSGVPGAGPLRILLQMQPGGGGALAPHLGAIAFYTSPGGFGGTGAYNTDVINSVENTMANYYGITLTP